MNSEFMGIEPVSDNRISYLMKNHHFFNIYPPTCSDSLGFKMDLETNFEIKFFLKLEQHSCFRAIFEGNERRQKFLAVQSFCPCYRFLVQLVLV